MQYEKTQNTNTNTSESMHSVTKPNPENRKNCSCNLKCAPLHFGNVNVN